MLHTINEANQLAANNKRLAPVFAPWFRAYLECSDEVQRIVEDMYAIILDEASEASEKEMAAATVAEALFPSSFGGAVGADLEELDDAHESTRDEAAAVLLQMDEQEQNFAARVEACMKAKGMTQEALAQAIGIGQPAVCMLLSRQARPQRRTVEKIAKALEIAPADLWPAIT